MKNFLPKLLFCTALLYANAPFAQNVTQGAEGMYPEVIDYNQHPTPFTGKVVLLNGKEQKLASTEQQFLRSVEKDQIGFSHYRIDQYLNGYKVIGGEYIAHVKNSNLMYQNGYWVKDFPTNLAISPSLSATTALDAALKFVGAKQYMWQDESEEQVLQSITHDFGATYFPKPILVYYAGEADGIIAKNYRLAYEMNIYAKLPLNHQTIFVDAANGKILGTRQLLQSSNATGTATTAYNGSQTITTDYTGSTYRLRETGRGNGINTYNMRTAGTSYTAAVDFTDADNNWNNVNTYKDQYATDAHWGAEKTYDFFSQKFGRNSIDNAGFALNSYVHVQLTSFGYGNNVNAFWDGTKMSYGDGNTTYSPLTAIDIAGHEITHGLTSKTSNLAYNKESGAMNEGFSDIFGTCIEYFGNAAKGDWLIGEDIGAAFRSMSNPNQYSQPDTYLGTYWVSTTSCTPSNSNDQCGVHTNSGVLNYWFYLLAMGGSGTNDKGAAFNITGLGMDKAAAIAYRTNTYYLTSSATYANARTYSIQSADDLYGANSTESLTTSCAWAAVNVGACNTGGGTTCASPSGLASSNITASSATISWAAASGAASYLVEYKTTAATTWTTAASATTSTSLTLTGLAASSTYDWRVTTNCTSGTSSAVAAQLTTNAASGGGCTTAFEPNETQTTATSINSGVANSAAIAASGDVDYYAITLASTANLAVALAGPSGVDYDLYVYNSTGTQLGSGATSTATESVSLTSQAAGTYYIKVMGYNGANSQTCYTLTATATAVAAGCESSYDNSSNGALGTAPQIPLNTDIKGTINTTTDKDYYKFVITTGGTATLTLTSLPKDYDVKILNSAGTTLVTLQNSGTTSESNTRTYTAGTYYAYVYGYSGVNSTSCYNLNIATGTASMAGIATVKSPSVDIYPNPVKDVLNIKSEGLNFNNTNYEIMDGKGMKLQMGKLNGAVQTVSISRLSAGTYLLKVSDGSTTTTKRFVKM